MKKIALAGAAAAALLSGPALSQQPGAARQAGQPVTRAATQAQAQSLFARADANRDGFVTQEEAQALAGVRAGGQGRGKLFARLDANGDGSITQAEAKAAPAGAKAQGQGERHARLFSRFDGDKNGVVTRAEFDAHAEKRRGLHAALAQKMFTRLDADKDSRVSLAELTAHRMARFDRLDLNRDGTLTAEERQAARAQRKARPTG